ncbi:MAG: peptidylprolyl isomerase [bacterium]
MKTIKAKLAIFALLFLSLCPVISGGCAKKIPAERTKASDAKPAAALIVDGERINDAFFKYEYLRFKLLYEKYGGVKFDNYPAVMRLKSQVADVLIAQQIFLNEARKQSITASDAEVDEQIETEMDGLIGPAEGAKGNGAPKDRMKRMRAELKKQGISYDAFLTTIRRGIIQNKAVAEISGELALESGRKAKADAEEVIGKLKNGAKFEDLAKQYSQDEATRLKGGDLGRMKKGTLPAEFESAALSMAPGAFTETPVETAGGLHVIQLLEKEGDIYRARHIYFLVKSGNAIAGEWVRNERESGKHKIDITDPELNAYRYLYGSVFNTGSGKANFNGAIALYNKAIDSDPSNPYLYFELGRIYELKNAKSELEKKRNSKAPAANGDDSKAFLNEALRYYKKAEGAAEKKNITDPLLLISVAKTQKKLGDNKSAEANYIRAVEKAAGNEQYLKTIKEGLSGYSSEAAKKALEQTNELMAK